ncbi:MAG: ATP-binding cassette domain-containing protein, partial [Taibaiella sp.]|nr:ATP-binding cassette domain-containing protein [Taibaiella sp.]
MSDRILRALMQLFAIIANTDEVGIGGREIVDRFLRRQLSSHLVRQYLEIYDTFLDKLKGKTEEGKTRKRTSVNSVKVLRICNDINKELEQKQKVIVLIRLFEFVHNAIDTATDQHEEFLNTVAETFSISKEDCNNCRLIVTGAVTYPENALDNFLITDKAPGNTENIKHIQRETISGRLVFLMINDPHIFLFCYNGTDQVFCDGRAVIPNSVNVFEMGSVIRGSKLNPVYYNDIIHHFKGYDVTERIHFSVNNLGYSFKSGKVALHDLTFSTTSKNLVGIMGNSGAGKTTLLNLLNSSAKPTSGNIAINGLELYANKSKLTGLIGNIPQDDLLIEELTVFQNLFFSSRLYFGELNDDEITKRVDHCLHSLMLFEIKDLMVGDPLNKYISGGQRKRLNIALELIREPEILFVDEPTSGLSSNDAENVMDLLKQLALGGKLIFVVIHQPASEIFKLFDQLLILDTGGYPVYFGNPIDSVRYFKHQMHYVDFENSECAECGNINPEEIFRIIESKTVDEFGRPTSDRKISSAEWFKLYNEHFVKNEVQPHNTPGSAETPTVSNPLTQYLVYFKRNLLSKINNRQYVGITLFEGPLLALILSVALRSHDAGKPYFFGTN